jgi:hypothetical protein
MTIDHLTILGKQDSPKNAIMPQTLSAEQQGKLNLVSVDVKDIDVEFDDSKFAQVLDFVPTSPVGARDMYLHSSALTAVAEMFATAREAGIKSDEGGASSVAPVLGDMTCRKSCMNGVRKAVISRRRAIANTTRD